MNFLITLFIIGSNNKKYFLVLSITFKFLSYKRMIQRKPIKQSYFIHIKNIFHEKLIQFLSYRSQIALNMLISTYMFSLICLDVMSLFKVFKLALKKIEFQCIYKVYLFQKLLFFLHDQFSGHIYIFFVLKYHSREPCLASKNFRFCVV